MIAELGENPHVHKELLRNTVEIVTGICENSAAAMDDLSRHAAHGPAGRARPRHGAVLRGHAPVRAVVVPAADRRAALRRTDQAHPVVGPADADLGCARARRGLLGAQGDADHHVTAELLPAPAGVVGVVAVVGRRGHRLRQQPGHDVPAAADGRAAVPVPDLERIRGFRRRSEEDRHHRPHQRSPLGHQAFPASGHRRGADLRRRVQRP